MAPIERPKRFYRAAAAAPSEGGFGVMLDARNLRTPAGARLILPTPALAELLALEWEAQAEVIDHARMPATRLAFTAADRVSQVRRPTAADIARQAGSDLLCYYAEAPRSLTERQAALWGPLLDWAKTSLGLRFERASGILHRDQPPETLQAVEALALALDDFGLAGLAMASASLSSVVLALALQRGVLTGDGAFDLSRLDEAFQEEQWGVDAEAAARAERHRTEARMLERWFRALDQ
ncbi:MAG TPA: ATP12 family protein [Caulobacteraceae bacterium]|jgi:chaperone required for assembly of F1-ATPase|nr:ATP12 family protein [Caulobacteraceae bacterium]